MKARIDAGSDVAMIGGWDAERGALALAASEVERTSAMEADAAEGHIFLLHTGADGGGPVDVYVDEAVPMETQDRLVRRGGEFLLRLPSGALVVGGAEDYRAASPRPGRANGSIIVQAGDYAVRCYVAGDEERSPQSEEALRKLVGSADLEYYDRVNTTGCILGALTLLLFPILSFPLGWKVTLVITAVVFVAFFPARQWFLKRSPRYQRLHEVIPIFRIRNKDPVFVLELRRVRDRTGLTGGSVSL